MLCSVGVQGTGTALLGQWPAWVESVLLFLLRVGLYVMCPSEPLLHLRGGVGCTHLPVDSEHCLHAQVLAIATDIGQRLSGGVGPCCRGKPRQKPLV